MPVRQVPHEGKIYAFNEGNYEGWETGLREYMDSLKNASKWGGKPYSARRAPALCQQGLPGLLASIENKAEALSILHVACHTSLL